MSIALTSEEVKLSSLGLGWLVYKISTLLALLSIQHCCGAQISNDFKAYKNHNVLSNCKYDSKLIAITLIIIAMSCISIEVGSLSYIYYTNGSLKKHPHGKSDTPVWRSLIKLNIGLAYDPEFPLKRIKKQVFKKTSYKNVHSMTTHNSPNNK